MKTSLYLRNNNEQIDDYSPKTILITDNPNLYQMVKNETGYESKTKHRSRRSSMRYMYILFLVSYDSPNWTISSHQHKLCVYAMVTLKTSNFCESVLNLTTVELEQYTEFWPASSTWNLDWRLVSICSIAASTIQRWNWNHSSRILDYWYEWMLCFRVCGHIRSN